MAVKRSTSKNLLSFITQIAEQYSLSNELVCEFLVEAFRNNFLKEHPDTSIGINIDLTKCSIKMWRNLTVVDDKHYYNEGFEDDEVIITLDKAKSIKAYINAKVKVGDVVKSPIDIASFNSGLVKGILRNFQKLTLEEMNRRVYEKWCQYKGSVLPGMVEKIVENKDQTPRDIHVTLLAPNGQTTKGVINKFDLVQLDSPGGYKVYEKLTLGNIYYFFVKDVLENSTDCPIMLSRVDGEIVAHLMKKHVAEIADGSIEIKLIARIAGVKTKVLVSSKKKSLDAVGCCIGPKGNRLKFISKQLLNEKIDVILWNDDPVKNVINSFVPGRILGYRVDDEMEVTLIATLDNLLSAIGKKGINSKLVYMLTGWKTNLKTVQEAKDEKIEYVAYDDYKGSGGSNLSSRIYEMHYVKNEELLSEIEKLDSEDTETISNDGSQ